MTEYGTPNITQLEESKAGKRIVQMLVGAVIVLLLIAAYFFIGRTKPIAAGEVDQVYLYPVHHEGTRPTTIGTMVTTTPEVEDDVLVLAQVKLMNIGKYPLKVIELEGTFAGPDGEQRSATVGEQDFKRVFQAYPNLADQRRTPLLRGTQLSPGDSVEGEVIFHYPGTRDAWDKRKSFNVTATFDRNPTLIITAK